MMTTGLRRRGRKIKSFGGKEDNEVRYRLRKEG
jgi:hypothetical protein